MASRSTKDGQPPIGGLAETFNRMKSVKRTGWLRRNLADVESLADHSFGAFLLALLYLPARNGHRFSKRKVMDMLLVHDLAEVFTGDIPTPEKRAADAEAEAVWFRFIGRLGQREGVADLRWVERLWREFEEGTSIDARIARDLDRLDNLVQLHVYRRRGDVIRDFEAWRARLHKVVRTPEGRRIRDLLETHFTGDRRIDPSRDPTQPSPTPSRAR
ncbi:MAG: HD domain-containing protein [Candidatus Riflebacteria bacterium]|nr:HD domain-containing protein [Candidatus Riflebacteria bacterium]